MKFYSSAKHFNDLKHRLNSLEVKFIIFLLNMAQTCS